MSLARNRFDAPGPSALQWHQRPRRGKHLSAGWPEVAGRIAEAKSIALFLDFDGTLAPFRLCPEKVRLAQTTRRVLERLAHHPKVRIWITTGRRRADIRRRVGIEEIRYWGLHGSENGERPLPMGRAERHLRAARRSIARQIQGLSKLWIEDKGRSFTIHHRGAPAAQVREAEDILRNVVRQFGAPLRCLAGDSAWEILPRNAGDKGTAVRRALRSLGDSPLAIYVGDDGSDELAFAALPRGITICVTRHRDTRARYVVGKISEVRRFLEMLLKELGA